MLINAPVSKVWKAITDTGDMKKWYFDIAEFEPVVGFEFEFTAGDDNKLYVYLCKVTEVVTDKKLCYTWRYEELPDIVTLVTFELFAEGGQTRVKLTHEGVDQFPADNTAYARKNFVSGWDEIIGTNLKKFAEQ